MERRVELLTRAETELAALPLSVQDRVLAQLELLREYPEMSAPMLDAFREYRSLLAVRRTYRIVYRIVAADLIEVAYIRDCSRQVGLRIIRER